MQMVQLKLRNLYSENKTEKIKPELSVKKYIKIACILKMQNHLNAYPKYTGLWLSLFYRIMVFLMA